MLITGGSRGLGFLLAEEFARHGAHVAICARNGEQVERARELLEERTGADVLGFECDVADRQGVETMVQRILST